ncbi:DUF2341 domain-containing protein [Patescibacteria group bacterium]|nr:DUF2341 domain-containing protein [Patescibacteria group bacterium]
MTIKKALLHTYAWVLLIPCFIGGILVYATIDTTVYTTTELVLIPGVVETTSWTGIESVLVQDVGEYALYQEFNAGNAAYPVVTPQISNESGGDESAPALDGSPSGEGVGVSIDSVYSEGGQSVEVPVEESEGEGSVQPDAAALPQAERPEPIVEESVNEVPSDTEPQPAPSPDPVTEPQVRVPSDSSIVWGVFPTSRGVFPHAQEVSEAAVDAESQSEPTEITAEPALLAPNEVPLVNEEVLVLDGELESVPVVDEESSAIESFSADEGIDGEDEAGGDSEVANVNEIAPAETSVVPSGPALGAGEFVASIPACEAEDGCGKYPVSFSGFTLPEFDGASVLDNAQLRLSLAAKRNSATDYSGPQRFSIEFRYGSTTEFKVASIIDVEDEVSNGINGGYYLISFETPPQLADLSNLEVRVVFEGNLEAMESAYVESVWLEVTAGSFYEDASLASTTDQITYERDLALPKFHGLHNPDIDQTLSSLPSFTLSYAPQDGFLRRMWNAVFSENIYSVDSVRLTDAFGEVVDVPVSIEYHDETTWIVHFKGRPQKLVAGKYALSISINENDHIYVDSFEFYWGVLAVNSTKTMYGPGERVRLQMAALTDRGDTICDANLELKIIDPNNAISEVPVVQSGACGKNNVTNIPDYESQFGDTNTPGRYTVQLTHRNAAGSVVHVIEDFFEVHEYIPFDIERTAPTRIYPLAAYDVAITVEARRSFVGDIVERVPRGFVFEDTGGAEVVSRPDFTELVWKAVELKEGEKRTFSYRFDAPDLSPYTYLLGPLDMDGFRELRSWQIASDALSGIGWFTGTRTVGSTNLNNAASPLQWSTSTVDSYYFSHSTSTNSQTVTLRQSGDYFMAVTLPMTRTDGAASRSRVGVEVRVNGVAVPQGLGRSGFIRNANSHSESSSHAQFMLSGAQAGDEVTVQVQGLGTIEVTDIVNVSGQASMYVEYVQPTNDVFAATTTRTTNSTNLNQVTPFPFQWTETRQDAGYIHSNTISPENITILNPGTYRVHLSVPVTGDTTSNQNILGRVLLNGVQVSGGVFSQAYTAANADADADFNSSLHWSGVVVATTTNQVLTITAEREANTGTVTVSTSTGFVGSIYIEKMTTADTIVLRGRNLSGGIDWSDSPRESLLFDTSVIKDEAAFTHSTTTNNDDIIVDQAGTYLLTYNNALISGTQHANTRITVEVNGVAVSGAQTKSHYVRGQNAHDNSSGVLVFLLENLAASATINVMVEQEGANATTDDVTDAVITLTKKLDVDERPAAPTTFNTPFDNIRFASTTPFFDFRSVDPDGASNLTYEFALATSADFSNGITRFSSSSAGFRNTASTTDTSPFNENETIRFQLQPADALTDRATYYWRVRARDVSGSGEYGDWSVTQSLTVDLAVAVPNWYQSFDGQFEGNSFVGTVSSGNDRIQVDATVNQELLAAYAEGTVATPRYRLWNGTSWGLELNAVAVSNTINWVETAAAVNRNEYAMVTLDQSNDAFAQIYQASSSSWGNQVLLSNVLTSNIYRGIALTYESLSGDLMAISCTNGADPVFRIWNGSSWSATSTIDVSSLNNCNYIQAASDPTSDEIIVVVRDTGTQYEAMVWDGTAWVNNRIIGVPPAVAPEGVDVVYESSGEQALIVAANGTAASFAYTTWNGSEFSANTTQGIGNDLYYASLSPNPDSDAIVLCYVDADADIGAIRWDGGVWSATSELTTTGNAITGRPIDCEYETVAGRSGNIIAPYSDTGVDGDYHATFSTTTNSWTTNQAGSNMNDALWVQTERTSDGIVMALHYDDENDRLDTARWNGSGWTTSETLEAVIPAGGIYEAMSMSAKRFQFVQGTVRTPIINFNFVPNQATWGDITFSTSEPFGTDVKLRLRYTASTTCDTYVPNGALSGNSAGFDVTQSPINLTGLSTTTFSQICLEATLTTQGSESASLEDWILSWVREPRLIQSAYRWYSNGSFLTPTDAWPIGGVDIAESTAIDSSYAVSNSEAIRLRIALRGANVIQPTSTEQFKLQYAPGFTCSPGLAWADVGDTSSTTALWRGYENSIVGSDWYSASWLRRLKITVNKSLVSGVITNFPVYVNLDDLPDSFFTQVQSDGDDIRVTTSNGLTEVPFELVSINTTTRMGELHFKGDLSTSTDSEFYIYYGNPSASGYAVTAPFGRNNVWTNGYEAVYHLETSPASNLTDSTSNGRTLTTNGGMLGSQSTSSVMGNGVDFDGINDRLTNTAWSWLNTSNAVTVTAWNNVSTAETKTASLFGFNVSGTERLATHAPWNDAVLYWDYGTCCGVGGRLTTNYSAIRNKWTHIGLVSRGVATPGFMGIYLDGTAVATSTISDDPNVALTGFSLGSDLTTGGNHHDGRIDEFRIASVERSAGWILTERTNQSNPTGFYAVSSEELIGDGRVLPSTVLSASDYAETYEERNPTLANRNGLVVGNDAEWDFALQNNGAAANTNYCFRLVYNDGATLNTYTNYPRLITNAPPANPINEAPFDNEQTASTSPWFEFYANDALGDLISYEIEIDDSADFSSPVVTRNSVDTFALFTNLSNPSERSQYTSGQTIRFIPNAALANNTTYWWRVRGRDDFGSNTTGEWSVPTSVTVNSGTTITTWFQTTGEQFATNILFDAVVSTSSNDTGIDSGFTVATVTSSVIDYDDRDTGNAWGAFSYVHDVTSGSIRYYIEYRVGGDTFALVPDAALPGNSAGFTSSPVTLTNLNTSTYNELRIRAVLSGNSTVPRLQAWTVTWAETTTVPSLVTLFDNAKSGTTTPAVTFSSTDPESQDIRYEVQVSTSPLFTSSSTFLSGIDGGFINTASSSDTSPFRTGNVIRYQFQSPLLNGTTYWWRVRARDPGGSDTWTRYSSPRSFTIDTSITTSVWSQTTGDQFSTNSREDISTTTGAAVISTVVNEVMVTYGEGTGQAPRYRLWNGTAWDAAQTAESVGAQVRTVRLKAAPTRPEYALGTTGTDNDVNVQIYNSDSDTWSNVLELFNNVVNAERRAVDLAYETTSGDLMAISCAGTDAVYAIWNGTSWSATSSINLVNTNSCEWVLAASDPVSDEIIAVFRHTVAAGVDYEAMVWNGSSWTATTTFGELVEPESEGMALTYEESGNQAVLVVSTTTSTAAGSLFFRTWNGSAWSVASSATLGDHMEFGVLRPDVGTDRLALCYVDNDNNSGFALWNGSSWDAPVEVEPVAANGNNALPIDCAFETAAGRDGNLMITYSDNGTLSFYQTFSTVLSGELPLSTMPDGYEMEVVRAGDGRIHVTAFDDGALTNDDILASDWSGSFSALTTITGNSSQDANPEYTNASNMAARTYPIFTGGSMRSTSIDFDDGDGPRWEEITLNEATPGASTIEYRLYYRASTSLFTLVPDAVLPGNSVGFGSGPINISSLDTSIFNELQLDAQFICVAGNCPSLNEWAVEWSEGITVSGSAREFDGIATTTSGTVAVAVNGVLQAGKTGSITATGTWSVSNVSAFAGDTITVFVDGATDANEAVGVTTYDGIGNVTNMELTKRHLTIGSDDGATTTNAQFAGFDNVDDEDLFFTVGVGDVLTVCVEAVCGDGRLKVRSGSVYQPGALVATHDFANFGTFRPATNTLRISGSYNQQGTFIEDTSTILFTATSGTETLTATGTQYSFFNLSFGEASSTASYVLSRSLDVNGSLTITHGTLARATSTITVAGNLAIGFGGTMSGIATTTFDGTGSNTWGDSKASSTNIGFAVIDGAAKTITLSANVGAQSVTIGGDDTLNASGSGFNISVFQNWTNNNAFVAQGGTVTFVGTSTSGTISRGVSAFNNLSFTGAGSSWSFATATLVVSGSLSIATGTVTLPTGTTTIAGSFTNNGIFLHNNGEVRMTSTVAGRTITQSATVFNNAFYDLVFTGSGAWSFTESAATTSRNFRITAGTVTFPGGTLTVGGDFLTTGTGVFAHNNGEVILLVQQANTVSTNGSSFNNLRTRGSSGSWYGSGWTKRISVTVQSSQVPTTLTDFPVYINLSNLPDAFFSGVRSDGGDIRMTTADGVTEVPVEVVAINTVAKTGEVHFKAPTISSSTNTVFYVYYGNASAATNTASSTFGRNNVWTNGYEAVYHLETIPTGLMVDSTQNARNLTSFGAMDGSDSVPAVLGNGIDFDGVNDYLANAGFVWPNASNTITVTAWNNVSTAETKNANLFGFTESGGQRIAAHGPWGDAVLYWDFGTAGVPGRVTTSYASYRDKWTHMGLISPGAGGGNMSIFLDGAFIASSAAGDPSATLTGFSLGSLGASQYHDGRIDEFRIASVARTGGWMTTERNNQASSTTFYAVSGEELRRQRTFTDSNAVILGNFVLETGGDATFPNGTLSVGGSFDNDATFAANGGTVRFNSTAGAETIAVGTTSNFATLEFNSVTGNFTITENATATVAVNLTQATQFTLQSGRVLSALGTFTNTATGSSTTWTGSVLSLGNGSSSTLNVKTHGGDVYGTLRAASSTLVRMWNSSATTYETAGATGAIYSQDHAGVDGDLNIYGNYVRTSGTEHWSFATDFDGVVLTGSTSRQVDVRVASSSSVGLVNATLNLTGTTTASTTVAAVSGSYAFSATSSTLTAEHFTFAGLDTTGMALRASTTLSTFRDGFFTVVPGRTGITISSTTVEQNPSAQFFRIGFASTTPGAGSNVTLVGTTSQFVWFRTGSGNLYGEAFDAGDGNPGSIRFDDSSNSIVVSGIVYSDDGVTALGAPTCNGTSLNVRIVVDGGTYSSSTSCAAGTGAYSFPAVNYIGDPKVIVYLDTNGGVQGSVVTKTPTANISNMHIYANRVITRHQDVTPLTASDMILFDVDNDSDIRFSAASTSLVVLPGTELFVFASTSFAPLGNVTLLGNASSTGFEGTLQIGANATFTAQGTETHTLAGRLVLRSGGVFTPASSTVVFNATTSGKSITSSSTVSFNDVQFNGVGGTWNIGANLTVLGNMQVATGTVTGTGSITLPNGSLTGNGTLSLGGGTVSIARSTTLGGITPWTFHSLTLGNGSVVGTTTPGGIATTTVVRTLTISNAHFLDANDSRWDLSGSSTVLVETGTLLEDTSTFRYSGAGANVTATNYFNLMLTAGVGSSTYTALGSGSIILNDLTVGGAASTTLNLNTNDPLYEVRGNVIIHSNGTVVASDNNTLTVLGNWTNNGTFVGSGGIVRFTGSSTTAIAAGASSFSSVLINGTGSFTVTQNATATNAFTLTNHAAFAVASGRSLAVGGQFTNTIGGASTTWTGSTLSLYGTGTFEINASTTSDVYSTLAVGAGSHIRMWNSSSTVYAINSTGSLYSQDHAGVNGDLYVYGTMVRTTGSDHWSFSTDFDGSPLATSTGRQVRVYFASSSGAFYSGGSLSVIGTSSASTTLQNQGVGTYGLHLSGTVTTRFDRVVVRDVNSSGIILSGTPTVTDFSRTDHLIKINNASALTVGGTVINQNPSKNFTNNFFEADTGVTGAVNVTATGSAIAAWRFTNHTGNRDGEAFDVDPNGDPGYLVWDDSAALITVAGNVFSDEGSTVSIVCNGSSNVIRLVVAGLTTYDTSCAAGTGAYSIPNVAYSANDTLTVFLNGTTSKAVTVSADPISSIANFNLIERRVILRHEGTDPLTIDDIAVYDSSEDGDIPFTAISGTPDTLSLPADRKLLLWTGKTFASGGNVTLVGGGSGDAVDGTLEAQASATFRAAGTENHSIAGSMIFGTSAVFTAAQSTVTFTTTGSGRTVDVNAGSFFNASFTGSGSWTVTDPLLTLGGSYTQSAGTITFPTGTTTVGASFNATGGAFVINGSPLSFISTSTGNTVRFDESVVRSLTFSGVGGGWNMTDTNATATASVIKTAGSLSLPSGNFAIGGSFENRGGTVINNTSDLIMTSTSTAIVRASSSDLHAIRFTGTGPFTIADANSTFLDDFAVNAGAVTLGTGTTAVGGSFTATGGTFANATGTVLMNAPGGGRTIAPGVSSFYNLHIGAPSGSYTMSSATTTNNFTISSVTGLTVSPGAAVRVGGVFTNSVGGAATTWTGSMLVLTSGTSYSINTRSNAGDTYGTLQVGANTDIRSWYSSAATTTVAASGSLYSQDNNNVNGHLYIYGDLVLATTTEYWNYATDFDGTALTGVERKVSVFLASNATTTLQSGTLQLLGASGNTTSVESQQSSSTYAFFVSGGTFNANYYSFSDLDIDGLQLSGTPTVTDLSNGLFDVTVNSASLITLSSTTLNANPSKVYDAIGFTASGSLSGFNVELIGETSNAWRFTNSYGNIDGEAFDIDGIDACGSIRFDDSSCLLTEQTHIRWRNDDGGEGVQNSEWYNGNWNFRKRVRFVNESSSAATSSTALKMTVAYDSDMQSDFDDLRFTDDDGTTLLSHWVEKFTPSTNAVVWVEVPNVAALDTTTVFMYYGNGSSTSASSGTSTFAVFDDFEDNSISEYSGDTALFQTDTAPVYGGTYALEPSNTLGRTLADGISRTDQTITRGQVIRWMQYVNVTAPEDDACTFFGVQSPGSSNQNYAVCLQRFGVDRMLIGENITDNDTSGVVLSSTTVTFATGWYEVEVDWQANNTIAATLYTESGTVVASTSATDASYTSGGFGFGYWINKGAWDSFTTRTRGAGRPTVYFGAEQTDGGATWAGVLDGAGNGYEPGDVARLRVAIENSGLNITNQQFRLQYAAKGAAPTCESVIPSNFVAVPPQSSCGSSPVCMATSTFVGDGDATTDLLFGTNGAFVSGKVIENPSNQAAALDINQDNYTELEYVVTPTLNASDAYCFRVTNAGVELDFYNKIAELGLQFNPTLGGGTLNAGQDIALTPGTTTAVVATSTVFDFNGATDLAHATATFYRTSVGASCTADNNSCYRVSTESGGCSFTSCSGSSCVLQCTAHFFFHTDPTDFGAFDGQEWFAFLEAEDLSAGYGFTSSPGVEVGTMRAISVNSLINYGALEPTTNTGSTNPTTTVTNLGNVALDVEVEGTDLTDGLSSIIPANQQKFSTSSFSYSGCVSCGQLSSSTAVEAGLNLTKPANVTPPVVADVYWGIAVPFGINSAPHSGTNLFTPVDP